MIPMHAPPRIPGYEEAEGVVITTDLRDALEPQAVTELLAGVGLTDADMAIATGAHPRTIRRWKEGSEPNRATADRLDDLRNVVVTMREAGMTDRATVLWLRHRNRELEDHRPLEVLGQDAYEHVRTAARAFAGYEEPPTPPLPDHVRGALRRLEADSEDEPEPQAVPTQVGNGASAARKRRRAALRPV